MTYHEAISYIFNTSLGHFINGEKFTRQRLDSQIRHLIRDEVRKPYIFEMCLHDGRWLCEIEQYAAGEWDVYIPETREQEQRLWDRLTGKAGR